MNNVLIRNIYSIEKVNIEHHQSLPFHLNINNSKMAALNKRVTEMTFDEVEDYLLLLKNGGRDIRKLEVDYRASQALPLANFIVILIAIPFASIKRKGGLAAQITAAMLLSFTYLLLFEIFKPIGTTLTISQELVPATLVG